MKFVIEIGGTKTILTAEQLDSIVKILARAERVEERWLGSGKGSDASGYLRLLREFHPSQTLKLHCMTDEEHGALALVTKLEYDKTT